MKHLKTVVACLLSVVVLSSGIAAQAGVGGVALPRKKTCTLEVPQAQPGAGCVVTVVARHTGTTCENGTKKITVDVTITCGSERCDDYPTQDNCTDNNGGFGFACGGNTITVGTSGSWTGLLGPNGSCDQLSATGSH